MARLFVTADGSWGRIVEEEFLVVNCDNFTNLDWQSLDEAPDSEKLPVALGAYLNTLTPLSEVTMWDDVPDLLKALSDGVTELSFANTQPQISEAERKLRRLHAELAIALGL